MSLEELEALLIVQEHDLALDRLRHQHATLPERAELEACTRELARAHARASRCAGSARRRACRGTQARRRGAYRRRPRRRGGSEALLRVRAVAPRAASDASRRRHAAEAPLGARGSRARGDGTTRNARHRARGTRRRDRGARRDGRRSCAATIAATEAEIEAEVQREAGARATAAAPIAPALLADYEKRRSAKPRCGRGAPRRRDLPGVPPDDSVDRGRADPARGGRDDRVLRQLRRDPRAVTQAFAVRARRRRARRGAHLLRRGIAGKPGPGGHRSGRARPVRRSAATARDRQRVHRRDDEQRCRVPRAHRRARGGGRRSARRACTCAPTRCSWSSSCAANGRCANRTCVPLYDEARALLAQYESVTLEHVRRELNTDADALVNAALDALA